jgi:hypothetical protein
MDFEIKTAAELADPALERRWTERREGRSGELLRHVLRAFADHGGPVGIDEIQRAFPALDPSEVRRQVAALDEQDLLVLQGDEILLAYPFSAAPTPFLVRLADGRERYACCAIDALGIAAMLDTAVRIRTRCHHCEAPLELRAGADGPRDGAGVMVWVGTRQAGERRVATSL